MYVNSLAGARLVSTAESLASAAVVATYLAMEQLQVSEVGFVIKTATVSTGNIVITVKQYVTAGSSSGAVTLTTITIPTAIAAGKVYYKRFTPATLAKGDELVFEVTTAAAGGGAAGDGYSYFNCSLAPEVDANNSDMVASA